jgi:probable HAF family extracellular repeat protein
VTLLCYNLAYPFDSYIFFRSCGMQSGSTRLTKQWLQPLMPFISRPGSSFGIREAFVLCGLVGGGLSSPLFAAPAYTATALPGLTSSSGMSANALNASGQVAGSATSPTSSQSRAVLYRSQTNTLVELGTLGGAWSYGTKINRDGDVAGYSATTQRPHHAFLYSGGKMTDLGALNPNYSVGYSSATDINDLAQVVGELSMPLPDGRSDSRGFYYSNGQFVDMGSFGGGSTRVNDINNSGQAVGSSSYATDSSGVSRTHAFLYQNGTMTSIGTLGGNSSSARKINDAGTIAGESSLAGIPGTVVFRYNNGVMTNIGSLGDGRMLFSDMNEAGTIMGLYMPPGTSDNAARTYVQSGTNAPQDLGTLGGVTTRGFDINDAGHVVGFTTLANGTRRAFMYRDGRLYDLNATLPPDSGWVLTGASLINNSGQIVASGTYNGQNRTCLLTPNVTPVAKPDNVLQESGSGTTTIDVLANDSDPEGGALTLISATGATAGVVEITNDGANLTYTPGANFRGKDSFVYTVRNSAGFTAQATVTIAVRATAPVAHDQAVSTREDTARDFTLQASDANYDTLSFRVTAQPAHGALTGTAPQLTYTPAANYNGPDSFTFRANDGTADSNEATVTITVESVNDVPVANAQIVVTDEDTAVPVVLSAGDADGDVLSYFVVTAPAHGTLSGTAPKLTYTPTANYNGSDSFTFKVNDGTANSSEATVNLSIQPVPDAPTADSQSVVTDEDTALNIVLSGGDNDGDALTYSKVSGPAHGTLTGSGSRLTYTPSANYNGPDSFTFKVNDGTVDSATATVSITVKSVNDPPVAGTSISVVTLKGVPVTVAVLASALDIDGDTLSVVAVTQGRNGAVTILADGRVQYTPSAKFTGTDTFTYTVSDPEGRTAVGTVVVSVVSSIKPTRR